MKTLKGSAKKVAWANDLRDQFTGRAFRVLLAMFRFSRHETAHRLLKGALDDLLQNVDSADFWIDRRRREPIDVLIGRAETMATPGVVIDLQKAVRDARQVDSKA